MPGRAPRHAARLTSALKGWQRIRFEATEEASDGVEAHRYSYTPALGVLHTQIGLHGDVVVPEERIKHAMVMAALGQQDLVEALDELLGRPWDAELEPFRYAGEGAPVRWLHKVVPVPLTTPPGSRGVGGCVSVRRSASAGCVGLGSGPQEAVAYRLVKAMATLWPPNPNELLIPARSPAGSSRTVLAMSMPRPGSGLSRLIVGGTVRWCSASSVASDSRAPGAAEQVPGHRLGAGDDRVGVVAERHPDRHGLGHVALRGRGGVGVDVDDVAGRQPGLPERVRHRAGLGLAGRIGLDHVVGVGGDAGTGQLAVDPGAARLGVLEGLDHQHGGTLAEHEAVAVDVPGSGRPLGLVVAAAHRLHLGEAGDGQRVDDALGAADHDDVGPAEPDHVDAERDRLVAGGAGRHRRVHAGLGADPEADVRRGRVGHQHRDGQRADPSGALLLLRRPSCRAGSAGRRFRWR